MNIALSSFVLQGGKSGIARYVMDLVAAMKGVTEIDQVKIVQYDKVVPNYHPSGNHGYFPPTKVLGFSSSGILEAATYKKPVVNIGKRQNLRKHNINVIILLIFSNILP